MREKNAGALTPCTDVSQSHFHKFPLWGRINYFNGGRARAREDGSRILIYLAHVLPAPLTKEFPWPLSPMTPKHTLKALVHSLTLMYAMHAFIQSFNSFPYDMGVMGLVDTLLPSEVFNFSHDVKSVSYLVQTCKIFKNADEKCIMFFCVSHICK